MTLPIPLIIAGATRCGTTSLFLYLSDHPDVCPAGIKETGFFLDERFPRLGKRHYSDGNACYDSYFRACPGRPVRLEATPDYLYDAGAAERIRATLPDARLVFILREPVERLVSWYRFAQQLGRLPAAMSFDEFIQAQWREDVEGPPAEWQHRLAMLHGRYSAYLRSYTTLFPPDRLLVVHTAALRVNPRVVLRRICALVGLDPALYDAYLFRSFNKSQAMRNPQLNRLYVSARNWLWRELGANPWAKRLLRPARRGLEPALFRLNRGVTDRSSPSDETRRQLAIYYAGEPAALAALLGQPSFAWDDPHV